MRTRLNLLIATVVFALCLGRGAAGWAGEDATYPVWWSPELGLESLDRIDALLAKTIPKDQQFFAKKFDSWKTIYKNTLVDENKPELGYRFSYEPYNVEQRLVESCDSLFKWLEAGFEALGFDAAQLQFSLSGICYALRALKAARPARTSHVRDFAFGDDAMDHIPAMAGMGWDCRSLGGLIEANQRGVPWGAYAIDYYDWKPRYFRIAMKDENRIVVERGLVKKPEFVYRKIHISIYGRGDFNGDGLDDLLMRWEEQDMLWGGRPSALYLVTRGSANEMLRVVDLYGPEPLGHQDCNARARIVESGRKR